VPHFLRNVRLLTPIAAAFLLLLTGLPFTAARAGGASMQVQAAGRAWQVFLPSSTVTAPTGIAIDLRGPKHTPQWGYVADSGTGRIVKFGTGGRVLGSWRYAAPGHPAALTVGGAGNLFVADKVNGTISKFSPGGQRLAYWTTKYYVPLFNPPYTDPRGIAVDPTGKIYLAEYAEHKIIQLSTAGTLLQAWDTSKGFLAQYSVPHQNSGPLGNPTGVVYDPSDRLFVSTVCVTDPACLTEHFTPVQSTGNDVLFVLNLSGAYAGYIGNFWFGLGYTAAGAPSEPPGKESEPFVHIDAMAGDNRGHTVLAGTLWPRGGRPALGVLSAIDLGYLTGPWWLPSQVPIAGVAVDGSGAVYVSQGSRLLKRSP
jgi:hypothetical protein